MRSWRARGPRPPTVVDELSPAFLPLPLTALIGRDADLETLQQWLQTMDAAVAWSYQLLDHDEQRAFRRFSVLPAGFPIDCTGKASLAAEGLVGARMRILWLELAGFRNRSAMNGDEMHPPA
jgi:hypothetical protein